MLDDDIKYWLTLTQAPGLGATTIKKLLNYFKSPQAIIAASAKQLANYGITDAIFQALKSPNQQLIEQTLIWCEQQQHHVITFNHANYPILLQQIANPPPVLYVQGDIKILNQAQIAVVGSRNPTPVGKEIAEQFAYALNQAGLVITSGLAIGIDASAHRGALQAVGTSVAVLANGLQQIYPVRHYALAAEIRAKHGAIVSEFPLHTPPRAEHFPQRNRIISGLSLGTLVVEAAPRSGSLITARLAAEQGREVFAVPGSVNNPLSRGCHELIQDGAKLVETVNDILEELAPLAAVIRRSAETNYIKKQAPPCDVKLDKAHYELLDSMGFAGVSVDQLVQRCKIPAAQVSSMLLVLELHGYIDTMAGGGYIRVKR